MPNLKMFVVEADPDVPATLKRTLGSLRALQEAVGGYIEAVTGDGWTAYLNEEGKVDGLPVNLRATFIARALGWNTGDVMNGTVVFLGEADEEGEDTSVTDVVTDVADRLGFSVVR